MNKQEYAVAYCDSHECDECYIYKNDLNENSLSLDCEVKINGQNKN